MPCTRAITGCGSVVSESISVLHAGKQLLLPGQIGVRAQLVQIVTGAEALAFGGQHDAADRGLGGDAFQFVLQRRDHRARQRVVALAAIERQAAHPLLGVGHYIGRNGGVEWCVHAATLSETAKHSF